MHLPAQKSQHQDPSVIKKKKFKRKKRKKEASFHTNLKDLLHTTGNQQWTYNKITLANIRPIHNASLVQR